jgi:hypothetical protein
VISGFVKSLTSAVGLAPKPTVFDVPLSLSGMSETDARKLAHCADLQAGAETAVGSTVSTSELLHVLLNQKQDMLGATRVLAHGLPEKRGLQWAADSAQVVDSKLPPPQKEALAAARGFQARPCLATRDAAALAAEKAGVHGPGGLAAKAASLASVPDGPAIAGGDKLFPVCVVGAVITAVALSPPSAPKLPEALPVRKADVALPDKPQAPATPVLPAPGSSAALKSAAAFKPFIDRGLALAAG